MNDKADAQPSTRLDDFEREIQRLGLSAGTPPRDRLLTHAALAVVVLGLLTGFLGVNSVRSATTQLDQGDGLAQVIFGVGVAVIGVVVWARYSLTRYLRYWLIRRIFEDRAMTTRVVESIERPT